MADTGTGNWNIYNGLSSADASAAQAGTVGVRQHGTDFNRRSHLPKWRIEHSQPHSGYARYYWHSVSYEQLTADTPDKL